MESTATAAIKKKNRVLTAKSASFLAEWLTLFARAAMWRSWLRCRSRELASRTMHASSHIWIMWHESMYVCIREMRYMGGGSRLPFLCLRTRPWDHPRGADRGRLGSQAASPAVASASSSSPAPPRSHDNCCCARRLRILLESSANRQRESIRFIFSVYICILYRYMCVCTLYYAHIRSFYKRIEL